MNVFKVSELDEHEKLSKQQCSLNKRKTGGLYSYLRAIKFEFYVFFKLFNKAKNVLQCVKMK